MPPLAQAKTLLRPVRTIGCCSLVVSVPDLKWTQEFPRRSGCPPISRIRCGKSSSAMPARHAKIKPYPVLAAAWEIQRRVRCSLVVPVGNKSQPSIRCLILDMRNQVAFNRSSQVLPHRTSRLRGREPAALKGRDELGGRCMGGSSRFCRGCGSELRPGVQFCTTFVSQLNISSSTTSLRKSWDFQGKIFNDWCFLRCFSLQ